jgi:hypothetical protein
MFTPDYSLYPFLGREIHRSEALVTESHSSLPAWTVSGFLLTFFPAKAFKGTTKKTQLTNPEGQDHSCPEKDHTWPGRPPFRDQSISMSI